MSGDFFGWFSLVGAAASGVVIGWVTYGILRRSSRSALSDITTVIGAVGGAAVTGLFSTAGSSFRSRVRAMARPRLPVGRMAPGTSAAPEARPFS